MSTGKLYQEAINEANDLVRMAEERARDKLIESVMPRIRSMLEKRILEDASDVDDLLLSDDEDDTDEESLDADDSSEFDDLEDLGSNASVADDLTLAQPSMSHDSTPVDSGSLELSVPKGVKKVTINVQENKNSRKSKQNDGIVNLDESNISDLIKLMDGRGTLVERARSIQIELKGLRGELDALSGHRKQLRAGGQVVEGFNAILRKSIGLKQEIRDAVPGPLAESAKLELNKIEKEIKEMSTKTLLRSLLAESDEVKNKHDMYEGDEESEDSFELDDESGDEDSDDEAADEGGDDAVADALKQAMDALKQAADAAGVDIDGDDAADEDMGDMDFGGDDDLEAGEGGEEEEEEAAGAYGRPVEGQWMGESNVVYEIDESMLRRELGRLRALREAAAKDMAHHFGGGKASVDLFEKPVKLNKSDKSVMPESDEPKGRAGAEDEEEDEEKSSKKKVKESRRNRALVARLQEATKAVTALNRQLAEQKLFNAKLLYVNKLMQSSSLTDKQFRSIVEALDSAKNLREAHLLYSSLSESLAKPGRSLTEGARTAGASSRPVGTASTSTTLNEGAVVDRWALLAGIKK